ncbi:MAG: hypothetical protein FJ119_12945, partial [Deltaproteobacteria bacterium]|nr:hypothetical protein [Deltaproteobacteria bacterium]
MSGPANERGETMLKKTLLFILCIGGASLMSTEAFAGGRGLVVVAGATGRTGQLVVKHLRAEGYKVRAMVRSLEKGKSVLGEDVAMVK